jgi:hypothetical protein
MDAQRKQRVARATADLLEAVREMSRIEAERKSERIADRKAQRSLLRKAAPQRFLQAVAAFADAIGG